MSVSGIRPCPQTSSRSIRRSISSIGDANRIHFTDKDRRTGAAELYALSDFKGVRKDMDVLKSYLSGRFDAFPDIDRGDIL